MSSLLKNLLFGLGLSVLLLLGYMVFMRDSGVSVPTDTATYDADQVSQELLQQTNRLKRYSTDAPVLFDQRFEALSSFRVPLRDEQTGRENPFAPLE